MRTTAVLLRILLPALLIFCLAAYLAGVLASFALDADRMQAKFELYSNPELSGLEAGQYASLAKSITGYLNHDRESAQLELIRFGEKQEAFSEKELLHLSDIRWLVDTAKLLRLLALGMAALGLAVFFVLRKLNPDLLKRVRPQKTLAGSLIAIFVLAVALTAWALADFDSLFYLFHQILFRNDLWLLNPQKDLLIQLMPSAFFTSYGQDLLKQTWPVLLSLPLAAFAFFKAGRAEK